MRYYATNYDNVALLAAEEAGIKITPVTLSTPLKDYREKPHLCVHINIFIHSNMGNGKTACIHELKALYKKCASN